MKRIIASLLALLLTGCSSFPLFSSSSFSSYGSSVQKCSTENPKPQITCDVAVPEEAFKFETFNYYQTNYYGGDLYLGLKISSSVNPVAIISAAIALYDKSGSFLERFEIKEKTVSYTPQDTFTLLFGISKNYYGKVGFCCIESISGLATSSDITKTEAAKVNKVEYVLNDNVLTTQSVASGGHATFVNPASYGNTAPFERWYLDQDFKIEYDFTWKCFSDLVLYGKCGTDYKELTNRVTQEVVPANIVIETISSTSSQKTAKKGSGFIFMEISDYYFAFSNCHVVTKENGYSNVSYSVLDYKNNSYVGYLVYSNPDYDLSIVAFKKGNIALKKLDIYTNQKNAKIGEELVAVGQPDGQVNAISYGKVIAYEQVTISNVDQTKSNVKFDVMTHDCITTNGSSGCAILNTKLELVGIHFAGKKSASGTIECGYAIPIQKVLEFYNLAGQVIG